MTEVVGYRLCAKKPVGRSAGQSVVNTAAYISRSKLYDKELGKSFSYEKRHSEVLFTELLTPDISPSFSRIREQLWNNVQWREKHKKAQFARLLEINLPHQLSLDEMKTLIINFVTDNFIALGMIADVNIHKPDIEGDQRNFHAHILLTLRRVNEHGFVGNKAREWNSKELFKQWRENLALACSKSLEVAGYTIESERWKSGHLTLKEQFINALDRNDNDYAEACDHVPTKHKGVDIHQMEKKGMVSYVEADRKELRAIDENIRQKQLINIEQDPEILSLIAEKKELEDQLVRNTFSDLFPSFKNLDEPIDENRKIELLNLIYESEDNDKKLNNEHELEYEERER